MEALLYAAASALYIIALFCAVAWLAKRFPGDGPSVSEDDSTWW